MTTSGGATQRLRLQQAPRTECQVSGPGIMMKTMTMIQIKWMKEDQIFLQPRNLAACVGHECKVRNGGKQEGNYLSDRLRRAIFGKAV